jgi:GIY-YIG catalytic domain/NUMOD3 motif
MFYTYIILNTATNKRYVGKAEDIQQRWRQHKSVAFNPNAECYNYPFYRSIRKYSKISDDIEKIFVFELVEEYENEIDAFDREVYLVSYYKTNIREHGNKSQGYNQTTGGEGTSGLKWSLESRKKFSEKTKGRPVSEETKKKLIITSTGLVHTEKAKQKMSVSKMGDKNPQFGKMKSQEEKDHLSNLLSGKPKPKRTIEHSASISKARKGKPGKPHTEITKKKLSEDRSGDKSSSAKLTWKLVAQIREEHITGEMGYVKLSKKYGVSVSAIANIIKNKTWKIVQ